MILLFSERLLFQKDSVFSVKSVAFRIVYRNFAQIFVKIHYAKFKIRRCKIEIVNILVHTVREIAVMLVTVEKQSDSVFSAYGSDLFKSAFGQDRRVKLLRNSEMA